MITSSRVALFIPRNIMEWLMAVSKLVAKEGQPMTWITPLGLPVLQPYRRKEKYQVHCRAVQCSGTLVFCVELSSPFEGPRSCTIP